MPQSHGTPLTAPIKRKHLTLFNEKKTRKKTGAILIMQHFRHHTELYGKAFIVLDSRCVAQVVDKVQVTCSKEVWQHFLETVLLEEKVTIPLSAQKHERQQ